MRNVDVVKAFVAGAEKGRTKNLKIDGNYLINYNTVIARRIGEMIFLNKTKYSVTTSRIQNMIRSHTPKNLLVEYEGES